MLSEDKVSQQNSVQLTFPDKTHDYTVVIKGAPAGPLGEFYQFDDVNGSSVK